MLMSTGHTLLIQPPAPPTPRHPTHIVPSNEHTVSDLFPMAVYENAPSSDMRSSRRTVTDLNHPSAPPLTAVNVLDSFARSPHCGPTCRIRWHLIKLEFHIEAVMLGRLRTAPVSIWNTQHNYVLLNVHRWYSSFIPTAVHAGSRHSLTGGLQVTEQVHI